MNGEKTVVPSCRGLEWNEAMRSGTDFDPICRLMLSYKKELE